jgi:hypothetical protein
MGYLCAGLPEIQMCVAFERGTLTDERKQVASGGQDDRFLLIAQLATRNVLAADGEQRLGVLLNCH